MVPCLWWSVLPMLGSRSHIHSFCNSEISSMGKTVANMARACQSSRPLDRRATWRYKRCCLRFQNMAGRAIGYTAQWAITSFIAGPTEQRSPARSPKYLPPALLPAISSNPFRLLPAGASSSWTPMMSQLSGDLSIHRSISKQWACCDQTTPTFWKTVARPRTF